LQAQAAAPRSDDRGTDMLLVVVANYDSQPASLPVFHVAGNYTMLHPKARRTS
jgi:hypothetical protein